MKKQTTLFIATALFALAGCSTSVPIKNFEQNLIPQTSKIINNTADVETGILKACIQLGWQCAPVSEGKIKGILNIRTHQLIVNINYDKTAYSINYQDSTNLNYNGSKIHRQYINWVTNLMRHIDAEMI
ncbi:MULTISPECIES: lipoprotein [Pseudoalteromonas]|jgi:uncharacterized protein YcfL|uniref:Lipoprotein n=3 Tax=Pseudoalteromonas TaxID=53246 RepID=Q3II95_PSET1|nr:MULTISPECIES: lipoprotein [Pseudoalteromonas]ASM55066.1 hypothetical protein PNIG_a3129 [Pseudoalteromonas nigrifaciens]MBB1372239.1 hypothetical protein [Pseudoalteromonas sp. SR45-4]MBB1405818.1 hypothetical protein [Pseudoalteromonas sp. SG44-5]MBE0421186.1 hypothetical protein [Pseudoalteromonas nigrifaciens]MBH0070443.1 hypothetical protein [Pseudoalteromonas sp. NZS127]|tara:strand:+ start:19558 stop:19944 length:387 start_codon:yes stop_codon:yes gene_type:complete